MTNDNIERAMAWVDNNVAPAIKSLDGDQSTALLVTLIGYCQTVILANLGREVGMSFLLKCVDENYSDICEVDRRILN